MNTVLTNEMKAILLVLCSQQSNAKQTAETEVENPEAKHYSIGPKKESYLKNLRDLTHEQFEILLPFLKLPIDEKLLSKDKIRSLRYNKIHSVWHLFIQDWPYFPDKTVDVNSILRHLTQAIDPNFYLDFVICFPREQKEKLAQHELFAQ